MAPDGEGPVEKYIQRFRVKGAPRPRCTVCARSYGARNTQLAAFYLAPDAPIPLYVGNRLLLCETIEVAKTYVGPGSARSGDRTTHPTSAEYRKPENWEMVKTVSRETWDGEAYIGGYDPFCTLQCALAYARAAHKDGHRYKYQPKETESGSNQNAD